MQKCFDYFARRIWHIDLCFCKYCIVIIHYLSSLTAALICFRIDLVLWAKTVIISSDIVFLFVAKNKSSCFGCWYSTNNEHFQIHIHTFLADFLNSQTQKRLSYVFNFLNAVYICSGQNDLFLCLIKVKKTLILIKPLLMSKEIEYARSMEMLILSLLEYQFHIFQ